MATIPRGVTGGGVAGMSDDAGLDAAGTPTPVEVVIEDDRWRAADLDALTARAASATLAHLDAVYRSHGLEGYFDMAASPVHYRC